MKECNFPSIATVVVFLANVVFTFPKAEKEILPLLVYFTASILVLICISVSISLLCHARLLQRPADQQVG